MQLSSVGDIGSIEGCYIGNVRVPVPHGACVDGKSLPTAMLEANLKVRDSRVQWVMPSNIAKASAAVDTSAL
jgi:hypothetical protein